MRRIFTLTLTSIFTAATLSLAFSLAFSLAAHAQSDGARARGRGDEPQSAARPASESPPQRDDDKAEEVLRRAVEAMGGAAYLSVRTIISSGNFTPYRDGVNLLPIKFVDYLVFPDRERTEFTGSGIKSVQTNVGEGGWMLDRAARKLTDVTPEQAADFRTAMRVSLDNILRGWWRAEGATLAYVGRREASLGRRNEVVRLTYPDGFSVEFEFGAHDALPAKALYKKETKEGETVEEEDRYAQFLSIGDVRAPFVIDHYRAGQQSSRVNFEKIEFNRPVPDSLFERPTDAKSAK